MHRDNNTTFYVMRNISTPNPLNGEENSQTKAREATFGVIAALSFLLNVLFCVIMMRKPAMLKRPLNILLFSLAITDLLTGWHDFRFIVHLEIVNIKTSLNNSFFNF